MKLGLITDLSENYQQNHNQNPNPPNPNPNPNSSSKTITGENVSDNFSATNHEFEKVKKEGDKYRELLRKAGASITQLSELRKKNEEELKSLKDELEKSNSVINTLRTKKKQYKISKKDLNSENLHLKQETEQLKEMIRNNQQKIDDLESEQTQTKINEEIQRLSEIRAEEKANKILKTHREKIYEYEAKISQLENSLTQIQEEFTSYKHRAREALSWAPVASPETPQIPEKDFKEEAESLKKENGELKTSIADLELSHQRQLEQLEKVNGKLKQQLDEAKKYTDNQVSVKMMNLENQILVLQKESEKRATQEENRKKELMEKIKSQKEKYQLEKKQIKESYEQIIEGEKRRFLEISNLLNQKQTEISDLKDTIEVMSQNSLLKTSNSSIPDLNEDTYDLFQSEKEQEISRKEKKIKILERELHETKRTSELHLLQQSVLKEEIRKMEREKQFQENLNLDYLKNVIIKYMQTGRYEGLVPVIAQMLKFTSEELNQVTKFHKDTDQQQNNGYGFWLWK